ncbi:hypothetical protein N657DRAFT_242859 [Parathielavia appendiculata]|uniref:Clr5 domain-containing protein n=1 Tax=Parathielavia appendiculata TaxID=2587402 RepID=A0AAN6Z008_9PEZI|nr:hypothetical protein N657DRAFT_242859 [Parathielavia appendiculata]
MPQPKRTLSPLRDIILAAYREQTSVNDIVALLKDKFDLDITDRTLYRRLKEWNEPLHQQRTADTGQLRSIIEDEFYTRGSSDTEILRYVRSLGLPLSKAGLERIRKDMGIFRRRTPAQLEAQLLQVVDFMETPSLSSILIPRLGRRSLWKHVLQVAHIPVSERALYETFSQLYPEEVARRWQHMRGKRGGFTVPGPNYTWSIDAYCKLQDFGFEVYAGIDAYSRYIVWCYVGISALTARSIFAQYLWVVSQYGFLPMVIRADRGKETTMVAAAHFWLSLGTTSLRRLRPRRNREGGIDWYMPAGGGQPDVRVDLGVMDPDAPLFGPERPFQFSDCWVYGKSTKNQRIEAWWSQFARGRSTYWVVSLPHI